MNLITALFSVARDITDGDLDEVNQLHDKAQAQVKTYHSESESVIEKTYVKLHKGWLFQLALIFCVPFVSSYFLNMKNRILTNGSLSDSHEYDHDDYDDDEEKEYYRELKRKYER